MICSGQPEMAACAMAELGGTLRHLGDDGGASVALQHAAALELPHNTMLRVQLLAEAGEQMLMKNSFFFVHSQYYLRQSN